MVQLGKVYENLMVDLRATNEKLWDRAARNVMTLTSLPREAAIDLLKKADGHVKTAVVMHHRKIDLSQAMQLLAQSKGHLRQALK